LSQVVVERKKDDIRKLAQKFKELELKKLIVKVYKEEKVMKMRQHEIMRKLEISKRKMGNDGKIKDDRVDRTIFGYYDDKFMKYYERKLGVSSESVNPFVSYRLTEKDYDDMVQKNHMKSLKLDNKKTTKNHRSPKKNASNIDKLQRHHKNKSA